MLQGLFNRDSLVGIEHQHFLEQIDRIWVLRILKVLVKVGGFALGQLHHELLIVFIVDLAQQILVRVSNQVRNHVHQVLLVLCWQQGLAADQFTEDAPHTPDIDGSRVLLPRQDDLGSTVPSSCDVVGKKRRGRHQSVDIGSCKTKVADLEVTVAIHEDVAWFQITVDDAAAVDVLQSTEDLVKEEPDVVVT